MNLDRLYTDLTGDVAPHGDVARELARLPARRQRPVWLRTHGWTWQQIGAHMRLSRAAARALASRALRVVWKRLLHLPRYHNLGHPPPTVRKSRHGRQGKTQTAARPSRRRAPGPAHARNA